MPGVVVIAIAAIFGFHAHWGGLVVLLVLLALLTAACSATYYAVQASRSLAAGSVLTGTVALGFLVTGAAAGLALWWGTRSYLRAMALSPGRVR